MSEQYPQGTSYEQLNLFEPKRDPDKAKRRTAIWLAISMVTVLVLGAGAVLAWRFWFGQGPQPAEALPANTVFYMSIDLDPSGKQKVEALKTLRKFPALRDVIEIGAEDDLREKVFGEIQADGVCPDLDYGRDVGSWLGDRIGVALLAREAGKVPEPVIVLQVTDEDKAAAGIGKLLGCAPEVAAEVGGHAFSGEWMVVARTDEVANSIVDDAGKNSLADAEDYERWTDLVGDPGIVNAYASPELGTVVADMMRSGEFSAFTDDFAPSDTVDPDQIPQEAFAQAEAFRGGAFAIRFDDGALEFESAIDGSNPMMMMGMLGGSGGADDVVAALPSSTAAALGLAVPDGWWESLIDTIGPMIEAEAGMTIDEMLAEAEAETGLNLPEDIETLLGEALAVVVDGSIADDFDDFERFPIAVKIKGDPDKIRAVLDKVLANLGDDVPLIVRTEGDHVVIGVDDAYLAELTSDGGLGDERTFRDVVPEAGKAASMLYVDFDANDWLVRLAESDDDPEMAENVAPLSAFGITTWTDDDDVSHTLVRLTTD